LKTFIINRKKWGIGTLLDGITGKMCCLGFCAKSYGIGESHLLTRGYPSDIEDVKQKRKLPKWLQSIGYDVNELVATNDHMNMLDEYREELISKIFKKHNIIVKFVGKRE